MGRNDRKTRHAAEEADAARVEANRLRAAIERAEDAGRPIDLSRERAAGAAEARAEELAERAAGYAWTVERDLEVYGDVRDAAPVPVPRDLETRAADFTPWAAVQLSDDELSDGLAWAYESGDTAAAEQIIATMDYRDSHEAGEIVADVVADRARRLDRSPLTNPAVRGNRRLTARERSREEHRAYIYTQWLQAELDTRGNLLNKEGQAKGVDAMELFSGRADRAKLYASKDLVDWWDNNGGRVPFSLWESLRRGNASQYDRVRAQEYGEAA
ncbi:hypothetical protein [Actinokineospora terrae]|nr:hypothetical protein [Actinokineospora terrae]